MTHENLPFKLFACCIPVQGANRSLICDLQRKTFRFIPTILYEILAEFDGKEVMEVKEAYGFENEPIIEEYFSFLREGEFIFHTDNPEWFPHLDMGWKSPCSITNAIIDIDSHSHGISWADIACQLEKVGCKSLQIRSFLDDGIKYFRDALCHFDGMRMESIEMVIKYQPDIDKDTLVKFCADFHRVSSIYVHTSPKTEVAHIAPQGMGHVYFTSQVIKETNHCGAISISDFAVNIETFTESRHHNTCLNRKISIDTGGNIKNCPSMKESYGNIRDTTLREALERPGFKKYWNITKDQVVVCKDCEFRYICTDCRAYLEEPKDILSKPLKCGYNPYTCEWEECLPAGEAGSTNPLKQKAIEHYGMQELVKEKQSKERK